MSGICGHCTFLGKDRNGFCIPCTIKFMITDLSDAEQLKHTLLGEYKIV